MVISFDLDGVVDEHALELAPIANALQAQGHTLMVVTGRKSPSGVQDILFRNGFPPIDAIITKENHGGSNRSFKEQALRNNGVDLHFDNAELNLPFDHPTKVLSFQGNRLRFGRSDLLSQGR